MNRLEYLVYEKLKKPIKIQKLTKGPKHKYLIKLSAFLILFVFKKRSTPNKLSKNYRNRILYKSS